MDSLHCKDKKATPPFREGGNSDYYKELLDEESKAKLLHYTLEQVATLKELNDFLRSADLNNEFIEIFGRDLNLEDSFLYGTKKYYEYSPEELQNMNLETRLFLYIMDRYWKIVERRRNDYGIKLLFEMPRIIYNQIYKEDFGENPEPYKAAKNLPLEEGFSVFKDKTG